MSPLGSTKEIHMAFTFTDANGKHIFDVAEPNINIRSADGKTVVELVKDGVLVSGNSPAQVTAVKALAASTAADVAAVVVDLNKVIAALKK